MDLPHLAQQELAPASFNPGEFANGPTQSMRSGVRGSESARDVHSATVKIVLSSYAVSAANADEMLAMGACLHMPRLSSAYEIWNNPGIEK